MKETAAFYKTGAWVNARDMAYKRAGGLCERCREKGLIVPGEEVHHKIPITKANVTDPEITLNLDNLILLCRACHEEQHHHKTTRYKIDELGRVIITGE